LYVEALFEEKIQLFKKEKLAFSLILLGFASYFPQHILYLRPLPHGGAVRYT